MSDDKEKPRPDWPLIIDEAKIIVGSKGDLLKLMLSRLRAINIGQVLIHQNLGQIAGEIIGRSKATPRTDRRGF
jgi:hypothetical protein